MTQREIIDAVSVLNETLVALKPTVYPDGSSIHLSADKLLDYVIDKLEQLIPAIDPKK